MIVAVLVIVILAIVFFIAYRNRDWIPETYRSRSCMGARWKRAFPNATKQQIRSFLGCFIEGMAFSDNHRLKFEPEDLVLDVYRSIYGGKTPLADSMECEDFVMNLSSEFTLPQDVVISYWHERITLGEMFRRLTDTGSRV